MHFGGGGRDGGAARGAGVAARAAVPRFRRHSITGTVGTGGALSRATPRRGTFASQKKTFAGQKRQGARPQDFRAPRPVRRPLVAQQLARRPFVQ